MIDNFWYIDICVFLGNKSYSFRGGILLILLTCEPTNCNIRLLCKSLQRLFVLIE